MISSASLVGSGQTYIVRPAGWIHANAGSFTVATFPSEVKIVNGRNGRSSSFILIFSTMPRTGLSFNRYPHRPRRPRDDPAGGVFVEGVEVLAFLLGELLALGHRDLADLVLVGLATALLGLDEVLQQHAGRRTLDFKRERAVF